MEITPLADRVVVKRDKANPMTKGGLYLPDAAKNKSQRGTVVAVGTGRKNDTGMVISMTVAVGDSVLFGSYGGTEVPDLPDHLILREEEILAIVAGERS